MRVIDLLKKKILPNRAITQRLATQAINLPNIQNTIRENNKNNKKARKKKIIKPNF